jgi:hypothetical protein
LEDLTASMFILKMVGSKVLNPADDDLFQLR